jgi:four helix bundle protein
MQITELDVWKSSMDLAKYIYELSRAFPEVDAGGLGQMMRKTVTSLPSNIAAAASRKYGKESLVYLNKAKGYIYEIETQLHLAERLGYITGEELSQNLEHVDTARKLLFGFIKYYKRAEQQQQ